jgi:hypothetical protein
VGNYNTAAGVVQTLAMRWDGAQWSIVNSANAPTESNILYTVDATGEEEVWAAGTYRSGPETFNLTVRFNPPSYADVQPTDYFYEPVRYLSCQGVISGYADGSFRPYNNTTRGQLCKIVVLAEGFPIDTAGGPHFVDVPTDNPFYSYIETAYNRGIVSGYADNPFRWGNDVTRGQLSKIIVEAEGWEIDTTGGPHFSDVPSDHTFYAYIETAYNRQIISGYGDGTFRPGASATRGQISKIVYNAITQP